MPRCHECGAETKDGGDHPRGVCLLNQENPELAYYCEYAAALSEAASTHALRIFGASGDAEYRAVFKGVVFEKALAPYNYWAERREKRRIYNHERGRGGTGGAVGEKASAAPEDPANRVPRPHASESKSAPAPEEIPPEERVGPDGVTEKARKVFGSSGGPVAGAKTGIPAPAVDKPKTPPTPEVGAPTSKWYAVKISGKTYPVRDDVKRRWNLGWSGAERCYNGMIAAADMPSLREFCADKRRGLFLKEDVAR